MLTTLDNGLTVLLQENHAARVVAFQAWVNAGSADETDAEAGLAHVHEHMLFKGTARRGVGEIAQAVEAAGGDINAWTSFDQTVYHLVLSSRDFGVGLDIIADAIQNSAFDAEELDREKEVILEEIKRTYDRPGRRASRETFSLAYTEHPYRRPVIGFEESVRGFGREDVVAFFEKHYRPDNVTLVLVGDFEPDAALAEIEKHFGGWGRRTVDVPRTRVPEPEQSGLRIRHLEEDVREARVDLAWHIPALTHEDVPGLDVASVLLGQGESSRLVQALVRREHLANDAAAYAYTPRDPGLLFVRLQSAPERAADVLESALAEVYRLQSERISEEELEKAKNIILAESIYQRETVQGQARRLGFFQTVARSLDFEESYHRKVAGLSAEDVRSLAERYLRLERLSAVALVPQGTELPPERIQELAESADAKHQTRRKARPVRSADDIEIFELPSGATLVVQEDHAVPLVAMRGVFIGGLRFENDENNGIDFLMARMLTSGTRHRSAEDIARQVDAWAGSLSGASGRNSFGMVAELLARDLEPGMRLFAECLTEPGFPDDELEKERSHQLEELRAREDNPAGVTADLFARTLFQVHPYRLEVRGRPESLMALDSDALRARHRALYPSSRLVLGVVGDVDAERIRDLASELFDEVRAVSDLPEVPQEPSPDGPRSATRELNKAQSHIILGYPGVRLTDPDRFALEVASTVLSGQGGRLFTELRDKRSLAYSVTSFGVEGIDPGHFAVYMGTSPEKVDEAVSGIRAELARMRDALVSEVELERAQRYLVGAHEIGLQRAGARAALLAFDTAYGLGSDAQRRFAGEIQAVTREDVLRVVRRVLDPEAEALAVVGPA